MDKIIDMGMLYDFYGELLTAHQKEIYEEAVYNDMSLSEIAARQGISKQGVHDLIRRCTVTLQRYEDKLHMIKRYESIRKEALLLSSISSEKIVDNDDYQHRIGDIAANIMEELS